VTCSCWWNPRHHQSACCPRLCGQLAPVPGYLKADYPSQSGFLRTGGSGPKLHNLNWSHKWLR